MTALRPVAVITGASSGIGSALAEVFAAHGHETLLVARRGQRLVAIADAIATRGHKRPHVLTLDLGHPEAANQIGAALQSAGLEPEFVVNNAGFGLIGAAASRDRAEQLAMVDLNIRAVTDLSLAFVDALVRRRGGILNVASVAAFLPGPRMAVYYASKAYVLSFSESLHRELAPRGVRVTALCPGPVPTEFQERAGLKNADYPRLLTCSAERVALAGYRGLMAGRRLVVPGGVNRLLTAVVGLMPRGLMLAAVDRYNSAR
jgi:short-subunit dehydrogenase